MDRIIGFAWISTYRGCIGIVMKLGDNGEVISYMLPVPGLQELTDIEAVKEYGTKIYNKAAKELIAAHGTISIKEKFESI